MSYLADLVLNALTVCVGMAPERPLWLRRSVQACWILVGVLVLVACAYSLAALVRAL